MGGVFVLIREKLNDLGILTPICGVLVCLPIMKYTYQI